MTLRKLMEQVGFELTKEGGIINGSIPREKKRITRKSLLTGDMSILAQEKMYNGDIGVFEDGTVLFEDMNNYTVFPIEECLDYCFTSRNEYEGITSEKLSYEGYEYELSYFIELEWTVAASFVGMDRIETNRLKRNYYVPLETVTYDGSLNYDMIKSMLRENYFEESLATTIFDDDINSRVDIENAMKNLTPDQKDVIHSRYWDNKKFQEIGEERPGTVNSARQRAKSMHDRGIKNIRKCMGEDYYDC